MILKINKLNKFLFCFLLTTGLALYSCKNNSAENGIVKDLYNNGVVKAEYSLKNGKREGEFKEYDQTGNLLYSAEYKNDLRNGKYTTWSAETGKPILVTYFENDTQQGPQLHYFVNGKLHRECFFKKGVISGTSKTYWPNGNLKSVSEYENGIPAIGLKEYTENGVEIKNQPYLVVQEIDQMALLNKFIVKIYVSEAVEELKYYKGDLVNGKFFPDNNYSHKLSDKNGMLILDYTVDRGAALDINMPVTAKIKTKLGNIMYIHKKVKIFVANT